MYGTGKVCFRKPPAFQVGQILTCHADSRLAVSVVRGEIYDSTTGRSLSLQRAGRWWSPLPYSQSGHGGRTVAPARSVPSCLILIPSYLCTLLHLHSCSPADGLSALGELAAGAASLFTSLWPRPEKEKVPIRPVPSTPTELHPGRLSVRKQYVLRHPHPHLTPIVPRLPVGEIISFLHSFKFYD